MALSPNSLEERLYNVEAALRSLMAANRSARASVTTDDGSVLTLAESAQAALSGLAGAQEAQDTAGAAQDAAQAASDTAAAAARTAADAAAAVGAATDAATAAAGQAAEALTAAQTAATTGASAHDAAVAAQGAADAARAAADTAGTDAARAIADAAQALADAASAIDAAQQAADAAQAAADAAAGAQQSANGRVRYITQATEPAYTGDPDTAVWIEVRTGTGGRVLHRWTGTAWEGVQWGSLALVPGGIVASDVLVQGSVNAGVLSADAVTGKLVTGALIQTATSGQRVALGLAAGGITAYDSGNNPVTTISSVDGSLTSTKGTLTGAVFQTALPGNPRVQIDTVNGLRGFGPDGTTVVTQISAAGVLTATGAQLSGRLAVGTAPAISTLDASGIYAGAAAFATAPFRVSPAGVLVCTGATISGTITGSTITGSTVRAVGSGDASLVSVGHALQVGPTTGANLAIDGNEILARTNGANSTLILNQDGGNILLGSKSGYYTDSSGTLTMDVLRLVATNDVGDSVQYPDTTGGSVLHAFQIGPSNGTNFRMDWQEMMSLTNGVMGDLTIHQAVMSTAEITANSSRLVNSAYLQTSMLRDWTTLPTTGFTWASGYNPSYSKDTTAVVRLRGRMNNTNSYARPSATFATLPAGYRPGTELLVPMGCNFSPYTAMLRITTAGLLSVDYFVGTSPAGQTWWLDGISFKAEN